MAEKRLVNEKLRAEAKQFLAHLEEIRLLVESKGGQFTSSQHGEDGPRTGMMSIPREVLEEIGSDERARLGLEGYYQLSLVDPLDMLEEMGADERARRGLESYYQGLLAARNDVPPGAPPAE